MPDIVAHLSAALAGRYRIERELGRGGMATVYLAHDLKHDRPVALKVLHAELAASLGPDRFLQEIRIAARLQHPHILPVHDSGEAPAGPGAAGAGQLWYTMPYVEGESLRQRLMRDRQLPLDDALRIAAQVLSALGYAHTHDVIHRDIKPENILLEGDQAVVADFGVARAITAAGHDRLTETGLALGTPAYMSPEQATASRELDGRSDLYALGCVLYEMLAGQPPFAGASAPQILARHSLDPVPPLRTVRGTVPEAVERCTMTALAKTPADRFPTAARFAEALAAAREGAAPQAASKLGANGRRRWRYAALAAVPLLAAVGYALWPRPEVRLDPDLVAVMPFRVTGAAPGLEYLREGMIDLVAAKLTGEGGARAADPRTVMIAWRRVAGSETTDLPEGAALELARRLGAGQLLLGAVVGTPDRLALSASLVPVGGGKPRAQVNVQGAADSLPLLVDGLIAQLIAGPAARGGLTGLGNTPLPALRLYLEGQVAHRRGDYAGAVARFRQALELDSTLALAGLSMAAAAGWATAPGAARRGLELAWASRQQLSPRDRALLLAEVGPRYPASSSLAEYLGAWEHAVDLAPDQADRWFELGDVYFHEGPYLQIESWRQRAAEAFRRSFALDSSTAPLGHLLESAVLEDDTAGVRRLGALYLARDSTGELLDFYRWRIAAGLHDTRALRRLRERFGQMTLPSLWRIMNHAALDGNHLDDADSAAAVIRSKAGQSSEWQRSKLYLRAFELNRGRPRAALADTAASDEPEFGPHAALYQRVLDALYGDGDSVSGAGAATELLRLAGRPLSRDPTDRATQDTDLCVAELWRLQRGELEGASRTITRLREEAPGESPESRTTKTVCAAILDAVLASARSSTDAPGTLEHLDSLMRSGPGGLRSGPAVAFTLSPAFVRSTVGIPPCGFEEFANLIVARLYERRGDRRAALTAVRRRAYAYHRTEYLATHLREEARLAALTGDRAGAARAYQHYLALRSESEPGPRGEMEQVRAERARLLGIR